MDNRIKKFYKDNFDSGINFTEDAKNRVKENIFSKLNAAPDTEAQISLWEKIRGLFFKTYVLVPLVCLLFITGTTYASANALPGDPLYQVKRQVENARVFIAPTDDAKLELKVNFAEKRLEEMEKVRSKSNGKSEVMIEMNNSVEIESKSEVKVNGQTYQSTEQKINSSQGQGNNADYNQAQDKARDEAKDAIEFLKKAQQDLERSGKGQRAREIDERVKNFHINSSANGQIVIEGEMLK